MTGVLESLPLGVPEMLLIESFFFLLLASIQDFRKREVSDLLNYTFIATSLILRIVWFLITWDLDVILWVGPSFLLFFIFSYIMYRTGQWGGGDVKIAAGVSIALASDIDMILGFFMNLILFGALYGLFYTFLIGLRGWKKVIENISTAWAVLSIVCVSIAMLSYLVLPTLISPFVVFFLIIFASIKYIEVIEKTCFVRDVPVDKLVEGDWLVQDIKGVEKRGIGLTVEDIAKIKKMNLKKVTIKEGLPFVPAFLLAFFGTVFWGNIFFGFVYLYQYLAGLSLAS